MLVTLNMYGEIGGIRLYSKSMHNTGPGVWLGTLSLAMHPLQRNITVYTLHTVD